MITQEKLKELLDYDPETGIFTWKISKSRAVKGCKAGYIGRRGYIIITIDKIKYPAHRLAYIWMTGKNPESIMDHINGNTGDNKWSNLRLANPSENSCNAARQRNNKSGVTGVSWSKELGKWRADVTKNGNRHYLGLFDEFEDAVSARISAEEEYHGDFTRKS